MKYAPVQPANLGFNEEGTPVSRDFDDIYFSNDSGLEETRYVFLRGNKLPERFASHNRPLFVVAESGFGTGLNFLALWQEFDEFLQKNPESTLKRLHFISFEKFPLTVTDLILAQQHWPTLAPYASELQQQWPDAVAGCHRLLLANGLVTLDLWLGDINELGAQLGDPFNQQVDAWFLDGFAPAKNPDMWTQELFRMIARLARPGCTLATFTAAGFVRRGLQEAGFNMAKSKGFGPKRSMLVGEMTEALPQTLRTPWYARPGSQQREVALIGGGVASALLALALLRRGWQVTLYCADDAPALGASGNRQGALYPLLSAHDAALAHFFPAAFTFARRLYDSLPVSFEHAWCGVTQLAWDEKSAHKIAQMLSLNLPPSIAFEVDAATIAETCGVVTDCDGITYPQGGWLYPAQLTARVLELARQQGLNLFYNHDVIDLKQTSTNWQLTFANQSLREHQVVVLANGHKINHFSQTRHLPVYAVGGQVSHVPTNPVLGALRQVLCYDGYLTPVNPHNQYHCIGASYHRGQEEIIFSQEDQQHNRQRLINCLPDADWPKTIDVSGNQARCGVRCATRDHLPMVGNVPNYDELIAQYATLAEAPENAAPAPVYTNLFMLAALGSRGLCSAPLSAEILAAQMSEEPMPMDIATLEALNPNRLWVRKLLKGKAVVATRHYSSASL